MPLIFGANHVKLKYEDLKIRKFQNRLSRLLDCFLFTFLSCIALYLSENDSTCPKDSVMNFFFSIFSP